MNCLLLMLKNVCYLVFVSVFFRIESFLVWHTDGVSETSIDIQCFKKLFLYFPTLYLSSHHSFATWKLGTWKLQIIDFQPDKLWLIPKNDQKWSEMSSIWSQTAWIGLEWSLKDLKLSVMVQNCSQLASNGPKLSKMVPKWSAMVQLARKIRKMALTHPETVQNGLKIVWNCLKQSDNILV